MQCSAPISTTPLRRTAVGCEQLAVGRAVGGRGVAGGTRGFAAVGVSRGGAGVVSVVGPQSSGKSTLLNTLFGTSFDQMDADVCVEVDPDRRLRQLRINERTQDSPSSVSRTG